MTPTLSAPKKRRLILALLCAATLPLTACMETIGESIGDTLASPFTNVQKPAPATTYGVRGGADSVGIHTVSEGETLWTIAERYKLAMPDIIYMNDLQPPYALPPNARIKLPPPQTYTVRTDDTLYYISQTFNVSPMEIARLNNLAPPYAVAPGTSLRLPSVQPLTQAFSNEVASSSMPAPEPVMQAHRAGDVEAEVLAPPGASPAPVYNNAGIGGAMPPQPGVVPTPVPVQTAAANPAPINVPLVTPPKALAKIPDATPPRAGSRFAWPVTGRIGSTYGPKKDGLHNDGINILAPAGAPVRAAENGIVVYAGDELRGFGNLILIRHADRWMTAYGHLSHIAVARGQEVRIGQVIGNVGQTGSVDLPQLHFEIRRGTEALNPQVYLDKPGS